MRGQKLLVLGASGLIGSAVARALAADNEVCGAARFRDEAAAADLEERGVKLVRLDVAADSLDGLPDDFDYVFNEILMGPDECDRDPRGAFDTHAHAAGNIIRRFSECKGIVQGSTGSVYRASDKGVTEDAPLGRNPFESLENYVLSKICADEFANYLSRIHGARVAILRYYRPYDTRPGTMIGALLGRILRGEPVGNGSVLVNPMFISDVADVTIKAVEVCESPPSVINVGGEQIVSIKDLATLIGEVAGKEPVFAPESGRAADSWVCDSTKRIKLLGAEKVPLREGIERVVSACL